MTMPMSRGMPSWERERSMVEERGTEREGKRWWERQEGKEREKDEKQKQIRREKEERGSRWEVKCDVLHDPYRVRDHCFALLVCREVVQQLQCTCPICGCAEQIHQFGH
jgi:hypothetical protein